MTSSGPNRLNVFMIGTDSALHTRWWNGSQWEEFSCVNDIGRHLWIYDPVVISRKTNNIDVFLVSSDHYVYWKIWDGFKWRDAIKVAKYAKALGPPAVISRQESMIDVFFIRDDHTLEHHHYYEGGGWYDGNYGGFWIHNPTAVSAGSNHWQVFLIGINSCLYSMRYDSRIREKDFTKLGGAVPSTPKAISCGDGRVDIFTLGLSGDLYQLSSDDYGASFGPWQKRGGKLVGEIEATSSGKGCIDVFARGYDGALWYLKYDGNWGRFVSLGGILIKSPTAIAWAAKRFDIFVIGTDGALHHKWSMDGGLTWGPSATGYEHLGGISFSRAA